jgi:two-component system sensor histidine kinase TctE
VTSISRTLVVWLAVPLTLLALAGALVHYFNSVAPQVLSVDRRLKDAAAAYSAAPVPRPAPAGGLRYALREPDGRVLAGDPALPAGLRDAAEKPVYVNALEGGHNWRIYSTGVGAPDGPLVLSVAADLGTTEAARYGFLSTLLWDFAQLDVTLVLVWIGIQLGLRPVRRLRDEIAERSPEDLRPIVESSVPREIAPLAATLNRLFRLLASSARSQQQFIANTAHQLRTPLTGMLAQLDLLIGDPAALPVRERLAQLQASVRQLAHSANQLLALARADPAANLAAKRDTVNLADIAAEVTARCVDRALQADIDLGAELSAATLRADPSLLDDLISNLVDNALNYTPAGGSVTVSSGYAEGHAYVSVEDTGPGIAPADRARVRRRFVRLPNAPGHGSGLGLAIVEEIAALYDGKLSIDAGRDQRGSKMTVIFPPAAAD